MEQLSFAPKFSNKQTLAAARAIHQLNKLRVGTKVNSCFKNTTEMDNVLSERINNILFDDKENQVCGSVIIIMLRIKITIQECRVVRVINVCFSGGLYLSVAHNSLVSLVGRC